MFNLAISELVAYIFLIFLVLSISIVMSINFTKNIIGRIMFFICAMSLYVLILSGIHAGTKAITALDEDKTDIACSIEKIETE